MDAAGPHETLLADLLAGTPGVRDALRSHLREARSRGDAPAAARIATLLLLDTLAEFSDFRGLADAFEAFDAEPAAPADRLRAAAVRLGLPSLDHARSHGDPALAPVRRQVADAVRDGAALPADERLLLAKILLEHDGMRNDSAACLRLLALMQEVLPAASPRWQARWWRLAASVHGYAGNATLAQAAMARLEALLREADDPEGAMALAIEEMLQALQVDDRARAERTFRAIEQLRQRVRPALVPHGLRVQVSLLLRRGDFAEALTRTQLMLDLCEDHAVPLRDRAGYVEQRAHAFTGLGRHAEALAVLEALRPTQVGGQAEMLEALIAMARAVQALDAGAAEARPLALDAVRRAAALEHTHFLRSAPGWASRIAALALEAGVEPGFVTRAVRLRRLPPPEPWRADWPWALHVRAFGHLQVRRHGEPLQGVGGKAQKKPLELLALLAARPAGWDSAELIDRLWPSLEADAPRASLEMAIARLRKWLDLPEAVRVSDGRVALHPGLVWVDVAAFRAACGAGDAEAALALYAGPLLPGEPRVAPEREQMATHLAATVLAAGQRLPAAAARVCYLRALAVEPGALAVRAALDALA